jgi:pyruvate kinase
MVATWLIGEHHPSIHRGDGQVKLQVLCTLGPASLKDDVIERLAARGVDLFRLNLSHTPLEAVEPTITRIRGLCSVPICLDTEGAQVRCGRVHGGTATFEPGQRVRLVAAEDPGGVDELPIRPRATFAALRPGSSLQVDFDGVVLRILEVGEDSAESVVAERGRVSSNRAVIVHSMPTLPTLTEKDRAAIAVGAACGIRHFALSFANHADDVTSVRTLLPPDNHLIAKIESASGVRNMDGIIETANAVLIDRGDLSREVALEHVPYYQKAIVRRANRWNRQVFVATNLLESMITNRRPTIAEANDIANTLLDGVHGLVLAAETAIGVDPVGTVDMVLRMIRAFDRIGVAALSDPELQLVGAGGPPPGGQAAPNGRMAEPTTS